jgi:trans-aconitate methyltransferase
VSSHDQHWDEIYDARSSESLSWFQARPALSLEFIGALQLPVDVPIVDVGAGMSKLADELAQRGYRDLTLLDLSEHALEAVARRLHPHPVTTVVGDVTQWRPKRRYAIWHDRAVFHFLTQPDQRLAYRSVMAAALAERSHVILATFAPDGPERCSGLPVQRYGVEELAEEFTELLRLVSARRERHVTPSGAQQAFIYAHFVRR